MYGGTGECEGEREEEEMKGRESETLKLERNEKGGK